MRQRMPGFGGISCTATGILLIVPTPSSRARRDRRLIAPPFACMRLDFFRELAGNASPFVARFSRGPCLVGKAEDLSARGARPSAEMLGKTAGRAARHLRLQRSATKGETEIVARTRSRIEEFFERELAEARGDPPMPKRSPAPTRCSSAHGTAFCPLKYSASTRRERAPTRSGRALPAVPDDGEGVAPMPFEVGSTTVSVIAARAPHRPRCRREQHPQTRLSGEGLRGGNEFLASVGRRRRVGRVEFDLFRGRCSILSLFRRTSGPGSGESALSMSKGYH